MYDERAQRRDAHAVDQIGAVVGDVSGLGQTNSPRRIAQIWAIQRPVFPATSTAVNDPQPHFSRSLVVERT